MNVLLQPVVSGCKREKATVRRFSRDSDCIERLFRCLADRSRLAILQTLCKGAKTQPEMVAETGLSDPAVSIQLGYLLDCGLIKGKRAGQYVLYGLNVLRLLQLDEAVEEILIAALKYTEFQPTQQYLKTPECKRSKQSSLRIAKVEIETTADV